MKQNPKMTAGAAARQVAPSADKASHLSIRNAIDYTIRTTVTNVGVVGTASPAHKREARLQAYKSLPAELKSSTPWKPSDAPWTGNKPSAAFLKMLGDYTDTLGDWSQERFDAEMSAIEGNGRFVKESQANFAKKGDEGDMSDGDDIDATEQIPYTGQRRNGQVLVDCREAAKNMSSHCDIPKVSRLMVELTERQILAEERAGLYINWTPQELAANEAENYGRPLFDCSDNRTSIGLDIVDGHVVDNLPDEADPEAESEESNS